MQKHSSRTRHWPGLSAVIALTLVATLLALAPFSAALEIHHELAKADHDGHEHSDSDLCQWVQHHIGSSLFLTVPALVTFSQGQQVVWFASAIILSAEVRSAAPPRAPPVS